MVVTRKSQPGAEVEDDPQARKIEASTKRFKKWRGAYEALGINFTQEVQIELLAHEPTQIQVPRALGNDDEEESA